mmetsp:Transcript_23051/g.41848  ORF Transcript_23051/g.41848 Transcript_23051/m.41848 type:complete len:105 (-) Transcript_23051:663-977(-)
MIMQMSSSSLHLLLFIQVVSVFSSLKEISPLQMALSSCVDGRPLSHAHTQAVSVMRMQEACHNSMPEFIVEVLMTAVGVRVASLLKEEHSLHAQVQGRLYSQYS